MQTTDVSVDFAEQGRIDDDEGGFLPVIARVRCLVPFLFFELILVCPISAKASSFIADHGASGAFDASSINQRKTAGSSW